MECFRLLLVDDEESFVRVLAKRLNKRGLSAEAVLSGPEALEKMAVAPAQVVVTDVKMPEMTGLELLERIKRDYPETEVILLTGHASHEDGVAGIKLGAFDYLSKPVELDHLAGKIRQARDKIVRAREKEKEAEFRSRMAQRMIAAERLASLGTLAAGVAHEINNPLAVINDAAGLLKLLLAQAPPEFAKKYTCAKALDKIEKSVVRARRITHEMLGFARKNDEEIREVDLAALVEDAVYLVGKEARNKEIALSTDLPEGLPPLVTDPDQIRQILINLVTNAIQATGHGGKVSVSAREQDENVVMVVADTGPGIPEENMDKIFEPFFSTKPPGIGTGLGLFVISGIVRKLGGHIEVDSRPGRGTTFTITIPRQYIPAEGDQGEIPEPSGAQA